MEQYYQLQLLHQHNSNRMDGYILLFYFIPKLAWTILGYGIRHCLLSQFEVHISLLLSNNGICNVYDA